MFVYETFYEPREDTVPTMFAIPEHPKDQCKMLETLGLGEIYDVILTTFGKGGLILLQGATAIGWQVVKDMEFGKLYSGNVRTFEGEEEVSRLDEELGNRNLTVLLL